MEYIAEEISDQLDLLNSLLEKISVSGGQLINVIWRESDDVYVVIYAVERKKPSRNA